MEALQVRPKGDLAPRCDDPDGVNEARDIAQKRQQDVQPEMKSEADLQEHSDRWQDYREDHPENVTKGDG